MRTGFILVGLLHLGGGVLLPAQRAAPFIRWEPPAIAPEPTRSWPAAERKSYALGDYRYEGLAIGGVVLGAVGVWVGSQISAGCCIPDGAGPSLNHERRIPLV